MLEKVKLGGLNQWINIKTNNDKNPVLLILHGGPGYVIGPIITSRNKALQDTYTVVNWDQRGSGKSYNRSTPKSSMTLNNLTTDAHELTKYLKTKFKKDKIYLMGHSFGTIIGLNLVKNYPEDYAAFISAGQVVSFVENEQLSYDFALEQAYKENNRRAIHELTYVGRPDENGNYIDDDGYSATNGWMEYYGGDLYQKNSIDELTDKILNDKMYRNNRKVLAGIDFSQYLFEDPNVLNLDFRIQLPMIKIPIYFLVGKHDYDTPHQLIKEYYDKITAPKKKLYWFNNSAHFTFYEEPAKFNKILNEIALENQDNE